jgi:hypothetical protein
MVAPCLSFPIVVELFRNMSEMGMEIPQRVSPERRKALLLDPVFVSVLARAMQNGISANRLAALVFGQKPGGASRQITIAVETLSS